MAIRMHDKYSTGYIVNHENASWVNSETIILLELSTPSYLGYWEFSRDVRPSLFIDTVRRYQVLPVDFTQGTFFSM